jgi:hypothetical protein
MSNNQLADSRNDVKKTFTERESPRCLLRKLSLPIKQYTPLRLEKGTIAKGCIAAPEAVQQVSCSTLQITDGRNEARLLRENFRALVTDVFCG